MSLRKKMLIIGICLFAFPLIGVGLYSYYSISNALIDSAKERAETVAANLGNIVQVSMNDELRVLEQVAADSAAICAADKVVHGDASGAANEILALNNRLAGFIKENSDTYESAFVAKRGDGVIFADSLYGKRSAGLSVKERAYFKSAIKGVAMAGDVVISKASGNPSSILAVPVKSESGEILGIVGGVLKLDSLVKVLAEQKLGETGYSYIVRKDTTTIVHPDKSNILKTKVSDLKGMEGLSRHIMEGSSGVEEYTYDNSSKIAGFAYVPVTGWTVVNAQDEGEFLRPIRAIGLNVLLVGALGLVIGCVLVVLFSGSITKPLAMASATADAVASGDLTVRIDYKSKDELGLLASSLNSMAASLQAKAELASGIASGDLRANVVLASDKDSLGIALQTMVDSLNDFLGHVRTASHQVAAGSGEAADSSQALSRGATEQAASLEEIGSSMTEVGSQTKTNAENASQANQLALGARGAAESGNEKMQEMISAMKEINESSHEIAKIIKAIDDIAFQTNLLALNAAVEAARAGKHGKGFAVVAQEVRNLAGRSAQAARETAELIAGSVTKVENGVQIVNVTAESLEQIVEAITKAADLISEIAAASSEQAQGISQINQGLQQIEQVTQQNTASAEQTASAAEELSAQSNELRMLLTRFKLKDMASRQNTFKEPEKTPKPRELASPSDAALKWGEAPATTESKDAPKKLRPEDIISLDEDEFGRY